MFAKINRRLPRVDFDRLKGPISHSYGKIGPVVTYYNLTNEEYFYNIFPKNLFPCNQVQVVEIVGRGQLVPHIDHNISVCANYYIETNNASTNFYKKKENSGFALTHPGKKTANIFRFDQITLVDNFLAENGDLYLLAVNNIHSVYAPNNGVRKFITWQWTTESFDKVKTLISDK